MTSRRPKAAQVKTRKTTAKPSPLKDTQESEKPNWTFLTNHAHVLFLLSQTSDLVLREIALRVGITERAVQRIIADLEREGFIERERVGRKNQYKIFTKLPLRHPIEAHRTIGDLITLIARGQS